MKRKFGRYQIIEQISTRRNPETFKCFYQQKGVVKPVMLGCYPPPILSNPNILGGYLEQAHLVSKFSHANIAEVLEVGQIDKIPIVAYEYATGPTLEQIIIRGDKTNQVNIDAITRIVRAIASAAHYGHIALQELQSPYTNAHGSLRPENVGLTIEGCPKILDWGVATLEFSIFEKKSTDRLYFAPEQLRGAAPNPSADIYTLAVSLFRATTRLMPYNNPSESSDLDEEAFGRCRRPRELHPSYPEELEEILLKALSFEPSERHSSMEEFARELSHFLDQQETAAPDEQIIHQWIASIFPNGGWERLSNNTLPRNPNTLEVSSSIMGPELAQFANGSYDDSSFPNIAPNRSSSLIWITTTLLIIGALVGIIVYSKQLTSLDELTPAQNNDENIKVFLREAKHLINTKKYDVAESIISKAAKMETADEELKQQLRKLQAEVNQASEATLVVLLQEIEDRIKQDKFPAAVALLKDAELIKTKQPISILRRAEAYKLSSKELLYQEAVKRSALSKHEETINNVKQVLDIDSKHKAALELLNNAVRKKHLIENYTPSKKQIAVDITSNIPAWVYVNDIPLGQTPVKAKKIPKNAKKLEVRKLGYKSSIQHINFLTNNSVNVVLVPNSNIKTNDKDYMLQPTDVLAAPIPNLNTQTEVNTAAEQKKHLDQIAAEVMKVTNHKLQDIQPILSPISQGVVNNYAPNSTVRIASKLVYYTIVGSIYRGLDDKEIKDIIGNPKYQKYIFPKVKNTEK